MRKILFPLLFLSLALLLIGCDLTSNLKPIEGEIYWEDGGILPPGSTVSVGIIRPSLGSIGETTIEVQGPSPIQFLAEYDEADLEEDLNYSVSVRVNDSYGDLLYISKQAQLAIEDGVVVDPLRILVEPVEQQ